MMGNKGFSLHLNDWVDPTTISSTMNMTPEQLHLYKKKMKKEEESMKLQSSLL